MDILIVYTHPSKKSYTSHVLEQLKKAFMLSNHQVEVSDLYEMGFSADMTEEEYEREGYANMELPLPNDVLEEHKKIAKADCIVFLYPLWWSDCPAKMKGWFDRVYTVGYAYGYNADGQKVQTMKKVKSGIVVCTAGHPNEFLEENRYSGKYAQHYVGRSTRQTI